MNILVTGSSGFVARYLSRALKEEGHYVVGIDRHAVPNPALDRFVHGDLMDPEALDQSLSGVEYVMHLAAAKDDFGLSDEQFFRDNLHATEALVEAGLAHGVRDWLFYSSVAAIGVSQDASDEDAPLKPFNAYGQSKLEAERLFQQRAEADPSLRVTVLRPSVVYGPEHYATTNVYRLIDAIQKNRFLMIGEGEAIKTTSYIDNIVAATLFLMPRLRPGTHLYHYIDEPALTTEELVASIYRNMGKPRSRLRLPLGAVKHVAYVGDVAARLTGVNLPVTSARIQKFCTPSNFIGKRIREEGFRQPFTNDEALARTVQWHLNPNRVQYAQPKV